MFYSSCEMSDATHLFVNGSDGSEEIVELVGNKFEYKRLRYLLDGDLTIPVVFNLTEGFMQTHGD